MCSGLIVQDGTFSPDQSEIRLGATYEVSCNSGFELIGSSTVTCTEGGLSTSPTCGPGKYLNPDLIFPTVYYSNGVIPKMTGLN